MLIRFNVTNFLSFKEETEFNMLTADVRSKKEHVYHRHGVDFLRAAALYGANGAGKSNLVKALGHLQEMVVHEGEVIDGPTFKLDDVCKNKPSIFEIEFMSAARFFSYFLAIKDGIVEEEELLELDDKQQEILIFRRKIEEGKTTLEVSEAYLKTPKDQLLVELYEERLLKKNELLLAKAVEDDFGWEKVEEAFKWFRDQLVLINPRTKFYLNTWFSSLKEEKKKEKDFFVRALSGLDTGVKDLKVELIRAEEILEAHELDYLKEKLEQHKLSGFPIELNEENVFFLKKDDDFFIETITPIHEGAEGKEVLFHIDEESDGTKRLFDLLPAIYEATNEQTVFVIDEMGRSLHPNLLYHLIQRFLLAKETKGQLIFTTHEDRLLDLRIFRQDEIWLVNKDKYGATQLEPFSDYKVRKDVVIDKRYLKGDYGGVPRLVQYSLRQEDVSTVEFE